MEKDKNILDVTPKMIERLSSKHIGRYGGLIGAAKKGCPNIRVDECKHYAKLWSSIKKKGTWDSLDKLERLEVLDAIDDELNG